MNKIQAKVKIIAEKNGKLIPRLFQRKNKVSKNQDVKNVGFQIFSDSAVVSWESDAQVFDVLATRPGYTFAEKEVTQNFVELSDLPTNERINFSIRADGGDWKTFTFKTENPLTREKDAYVGAERSGVEHFFNVNEEQIARFTKDSTKIEIEETVELEKRSVAIFHYSNNSSEKWTIEFYLNDRLIAKSRGNELQSKIRVGWLLIRPGVNLSLKTRNRLFGSQITLFQKPVSDEQIEPSTAQMQVFEEQEMIPQVEEEKKQVFGLETSDRGPRKSSFGLAN